MNKSPIDLKTITLIVFALCAIIAVTVFSTYRSKPSGDAAIVQGTLQMWGTFDQDAMIPYVTLFTNKYKGFQLFYKQVKEEDFTQKYIEALASGDGPDLVMIPDTLLQKNRKRLLPIPFTTLPEQTFLSTYADHASLLISSTGIYGLPLYVDPLVMYYNKDILNSEFILNPPKTWNELSEQVKKLTITNEYGEITRSGVSLGTLDNTLHGEDVLSSMFLQSGNPIAKEVSTGKFASVLSGYSDSTAAANPAVVEYFSSFSDPTKANYSYNESLPDAKTMFIAGDLAIYFGYASEYDGIVARNPNLKFEIATLPQTDKVAGAVGFGKMTFVGISKITQKIPAAYRIASDLASDEFTKSFIYLTGTGSLRRDVLSAIPTEKRPSVIRDSAVISKTWPNPDIQASKTIFGNMINSYKIGVENSSSSLARATIELNQLF